MDKKDQADEINELLTPIDKEKIPKKKLNFKELLYKRRIKYGKYIDMGLVSEKVKFYIKDNQIVYQIDEKDVDTKKDLSEDKMDINQKYLNALYYCADLDFSIMPSKREIKLAKMLNERIERYRAFIKKNQKETKDKDQENNKQVEA